MTLMVVSDSDLLRWGENCPKSREKPLKGREKTCAEENA
jgi:hypothetical protein